MLNVQEKQDAMLDQIINNLEEMRQYDGPPDSFWPVFIENASRLVEARLGLLLVRGRDGGPWKTLFCWPAAERAVARTASMAQRIEAAAETALERRCSWDGKEGLAVRLELEDAERVGVAVFLLANDSIKDIEERATRLKLVADTPAVYQRWRVVRQAKEDVNQFSEALDLMVLLNGEKRYMAAAMTFCNEVAARYRGSRVSLGWIEGSYIRLQAISHMERFERKMEVVQSLEATMEEAFDQDVEIVVPQPAGNTEVVRAHEAFVREQGVAFMASIPLRLDGAPVGVLCCEREDNAFSEEELRGLRVLCDQASRRLGDLKESDRWFGARLVAWARKGMSKLLGVENTFAKCLGIFGCLALAFLLFGRLPYRVEAPFILRSDDVKYLPAANEGYISEVPVKIGDRVEAGRLLLSLDTRELLLEESAAIANQHRYTREAEKARAENALAEMRIALSLAAQAEAQLDLIRYQLNHAEIKAPFNGIVVEGDLEELQGAPVRKGDVLFKIARLERLYVELEVNERDIHELSDGLAGEIAFVSQPQLKYPIRVEQINPVAQAKEEGNVFQVRGILSEGNVDWWRPGMSGVAKVDVGSRNVFWILTHRTLDFLRIMLWW